MCLAPPLPPVQDWERQRDVLKKPPQTVGLLLQESYWGGIIQEVHAAPVTVGLDETYIIEDRPAVTRFIEEYRLHGLLVRAKEHLKNAFGGKALNTLTLICDDEGFETLFCNVILDADLRQAQQALRQFDETWWLPNVKQAAGRLNFDFQLL